MGSSAELPKPVVARKKLRERGVWMLAGAATLAALILGYLYWHSLGQRPQGEEFRPPPDWARQHGGGETQFSFDDLDFADLFSRFGTRAGRGGPFGGGNGAMPGQDFEVPVQISIEDAFRGTTLELQLSMPEYDAQGQLKRGQRQP